MAAEGDPVDERARRLRLEGLDYLRARHERAHGRIGRCDPFGQRHHVRLDPIAGAAEPVADPPEPADHLVRHEQDPVLVADLAYAVEVALGRDDRAAGVLDRLEDDGSDRRRVLVPDDAVDLVGALECAGGRVRAVRAPVAVGRRRAEAAGEQGLELGAKGRAAVDRECPHRRSVVRAASRHVLVAAWLATQAVVLARHLERGLDCLRAARDEEDPPDVDRDEVAHPLGQFECRWRREADPVREERQLPELCGRRLGDLRPRAVADVDAVESSESIKILAPLGVPDPAAFAALDHDRRVEVCGTGEVPPQVVVCHCHRTSVSSRARKASGSFTASSGG